MTADVTRVLLISGVVSPMHSPRRIGEMLRATLEATRRFEVRITEAYDGITADMLRGVDLVIVNHDGVERISRRADGSLSFSEKTRLGATTEAALETFVSEGGGLVFYHSSVLVRAEDEWPPAFVRLLGAVETTGRYRPNPKPDYAIDVHVEAHPVAHGCRPRWHVAGDDFFNGIELLDGVTAICTVRDENNDRDVPVMWAHQYGDGRVFSTAMGHEQDTIRREDFVVLFVRACDWASNGQISVAMPDRVSGDNWMRGWPWYYCSECGGIPVAANRRLTP